MLFGALALMPLAASAQDGGTQSPFAIGAGSRAIGLGRSFVSLADDASSLYWNPATLKNVQQAQFEIMYMSLFGDFTGADYIYGGFVYPTLNAGSFGAAFMSLGSSFDAYDEFSRPTGEGTYSESQILISYAFEMRSQWLLGRLATGASVKVARINVDPFSSTAPGFDLGLRWIPNFAERLAVGVNIQDLVGAEHKLDLSADKTDRTVLFGVGWNQPFSNGSALRLLFQADLPERADTRTHFGAEFMFAKYLALRAGYDDGDVTFGLGVTVSNYGLDYAMLSRDEAGSSHPVTFRAGFGKTLEEKQLSVDQEQALAEQEAVRRAFEARVGRHRRLAAEAEGAGDWQTASDEWRIVQEYIPGDAAATEGAARARAAILAAQALATADAANQAIMQTRFEQGLDFFDEGQWLRARSEWQAILAIDSVHAGATDYLARTQLKIDEAVQGHMARARRFERDGRLTEAIAEWNNVQQYDPDNALASRSVVRIRGLIEGASQDLQVAQRRLRIVALYDEALGLYNDGNYQGTITKLDELLRLQPEHEDAKRLHAMAKRRLTPLTDAEKQRVRTLYLSGMQFFSKEEYAKAIAEWEQILEIDPTNESVQRNIEEARGRLRRLGDDR